MIRLVDHITSVNAVFLLNGKIVIDDGASLRSGDQTLRLESKNGYRHSNHVVSLIRSGSIALYDDTFSLLRTINDPTINSSNAGITAFSGDDFAIIKHINTNNLEVYQKGSKTSETKDFAGKILSPSVRINYDPGATSSPKYLRCSDLDDTETFFEYECGQDEEIVPHFVHHENTLGFFVTRPTGIWFINADMKSGAVTWEVTAQHARFNYDKSKKRLVSFWTTSQAKDANGRYQIVDLLNRTVTTGETNGQLVGPNIRTPQHLQYLYGDNIYFAENRNASSGNVQPVRFGRMNINIQSIDLLRDCVESPASSITTILEHDGKVYIRNMNDELFIYDLK